MSFSRFNESSPKLQDKALEDLAQMFRSFPQDPTPGSELLDENHLDFTVGSLAVVDRHLEKMRSRKLEDKSLIKFVLRCGAYVGEVIRRQDTKATWHWLDYEAAAKLDKIVASFQNGMPTMAILWGGENRFCFPIGKVMKYLENGAEDSVKFFAEVMISKSKTVS